MHNEYQERVGSGALFTRAWLRGKFLEAAQKLYDVRAVSMVEEDFVVILTCRLPWHTIFDFWHHQAAAHCLYHNFKDQLPVGIALIVRTTVWPVSWCLTKSYCDRLSYEEVEDASQ